MFAAGAQQMSSLIMIVAMVGVFYFFIIRPQRREQKRKDEMLAAMAIGDTVLTTSGFYGVLIDIQDDSVIVEFGSNRNCRIPMSKQAISQVEKPEPIGVKARTEVREEPPVVEEAKAEENAEEKSES